MKHRWKLSCMGNPRILQTVSELLISISTIFIISFNLIIVILKTNWGLVGSFLYIFASLFNRFYRATMLYLAVSSKSSRQNWIVHTVAPICYLKLHNSVKIRFLAKILWFPWYLRSHWVHETLKNTKRSLIRNVSEVFWWISWIYKRQNVKN